MSLELYFNQKINDAKFNLTKSAPSYVPVKFIANLNELIINYEKLIKTLKKEI
ncbi:MAG: hypothetical protein GY853_01425 [PVC group bacterium]|nr:hypothetical protein [PVC group bacterium]